MMTSISGERGVGKTAYLSKRVYEHFYRGFLCITNFSHALAHVDCSQGPPETMLQIIRELGIFKKMNFEPCDLLPTFNHSGIYVAIDEGSLAFPARSGAPMDEATLFTLQFLQQARKQDVFIDYSTVHPSKIAIDWRRFTSEYVRLAPVIPWRSWKFVKHPRLKANPDSPMTYRREMRLRIPLIREEWHQLSPEEPEFRLNSCYKTRFYWQRHFYFKMYDSYQLLQMNIDAYKEDFPYLKGNIAYIAPGFKPDRLGNFKRSIGIRSSEDQIPTRVRFEKIVLPSLHDPFGKNILCQPVTLLQTIQDLNLSRQKSIHTPGIPRLPVMSGESGAARLEASKPRGEIGGDLPPGALVKRPRGRPRKKYPFPIPAKGPPPILSTSSSSFSVLSKEKAP